MTTRARKKLRLLGLELLLLALEFVGSFVSRANSHLEAKTLELKKNISARQQALLYQERLRIGNGQNQ
jgi:hypothetical protein